ncbi:DUF3237 domain-containing protein [Streptomyces sp. ISL-12]|uniref:DUF3237 domain-containing protein n=1 Tax=Streptomyces sp. ISL-12 TaxID=2819177 RepID=UPI001BE898A4|nr:DUF3237 domain-containing protein [Streptomyces sp. ISL-12]MBT2411357.1 DUF3237 domain-containing protein [Streptomyces sp. ISL-12]
MTPTTVPAPPLTFFAHLSVRVAAPYDLGEAPDGHRRLVPLTGGSFEGPEVRGTVLPGGADHQVLRTATLTELDARYALETDRGERIAVHNTGIRSGRPEDIAALVRGEEVAPERIHFRSHPRLTTAAGRLAWLNERLFVATGERRPDSVELDVFLLG